MNCVVDSNKNYKFDWGVKGLISTPAWVFCRMPGA